MMNNPLMAAYTNGNNGILQMLSQIKSNPVQFLLQRRLNIPQDIGNDPNAILQHLVSTGQISQQQLNNAYQMAQKFR